MNFVGLLRNLLICYYALLAANEIRAANIVGFPVDDYYSHQNSMRIVGKEMLKRGHRYTQIVPHFIESQYQDIDLIVFNTSVTQDDLHEVMFAFINIGDDVQSLKGSNDIYKAMKNHELMEQRHCASLLGNERIMEKLKDDTDILICDLANHCCFILAYILNVSRVDINIMGLMPIAMFRSQCQAPVYLSQDALLDENDPNNFSFFNRLATLKRYVDQRTAFDFYEYSEALIRKYGKSSPSNAMDAFKPRGLLLIFHDFALEYPRPLGPHIKVIGTLTARPPEKLSAEFEPFMNKSDIVVLVSFGTSLDNLSKSFLQRVTEGLGNLSVPVLWKKSENSHPPRVPTNVKLVDWIPQNDILGHVSTKVHVTHLGLNSFLESVYHGVPIVGIPFLFDQPRQAAIVQLKGLGKILDRHTMTPEDLTATVNEVLSNKKYEENVKRVSKLMKDRKQSPVEEGADWIEYALRHDGAKHLVSDALYLPEYKLYSVDIFLFMFSVFVLIFFALLMICCVIYRSIKTISFLKYKKS
ncbi:UDP-glucuronosyltransferase 1A7-like [Xenia sp. Carnegie-2017]|uniref:UDP-glucuronosyltransferase 1A7-like n=1 Tax=Xenia sp. Carnegie-2017 TaxID=2897299 RepID=UPI001F032E76|nr:UDP-glucuronosyltransferase 1A7-like [Xenia sp. Carnegie-2017]